MAPLKTTIDGYARIDIAIEGSYSNATMNFNNTFTTLPPFFFERVNPTPIKNPRFIHATGFKNKLGINLMDEELMKWLNGENSVPGEQRISTRYAGHQFGVWAGQLGDGRAISLGEILTPEGRFEIQTKGSGLTPFSRMGDGKAVIRSSVREYLCSEAMAGLQIPTTRVLALFTGEDHVYRETIEKSAVVARIFPTNLRFGHFEMAFHFKKDEELKSLIEYTNKTFFPDLTVEDMLTEIVKRTAVLMARWMDVGFCHGVMNTDNMSILGLTIDYGPFGFLEDTILNYICNHSDHKGRYAYNEQPSIGIWNLERLLVCFMNHVPREKLEAILNQYPAHFETEYLRLARLKLGLNSPRAEDDKLLVSALQMLSQLSIDYTFFWRQLAFYKKGKMETLKEIWDYYGKRQELMEWLAKYDERLHVEESSDLERSHAMVKNNPKYVLKNYIAQEVIEDVEKGSSDKLKSWLNILSSPYEEHADFEAYSRPTPPEKKNVEVSCSS
jgi:serine/tyrosine/threonine adenylyltransferase